jgi:hypothetical protein
MNWVKELQQFGRVIRGRERLTSLCSAYHGLCLYELALVDNKIVLAVNGLTGKRLRAILKSNSDGANP